MGTGNLKREAALAERNYPTPDERDAFRYGWIDGWNRQPRDEDYKDFPNAYNAGYWEAHNEVNKNGSDA